MASETDSAPPPMKDNADKLMTSTEPGDNTDHQQTENRGGQEQKENTSPGKENVIPTDVGQDTNTTTTAALALMNTEGVPKEFLVKHPLQYRWVLWYCKQDRAKAWEECLKEVASFDTVEDFWALYNHIQLASGLSWGSDYYLFKEGIRPMWEDPHNIEGGRWLIQVDRNHRNELLDHYWLELLMAVIGEQFDDFGEYISGLVINIRQKGDKVSLWTRDAMKEEVNKRVGQVVKQKLGIVETINYEQHKDTVHKTSSTVKARLRV